MGNTYSDCVRIGRLKLYLVLITIGLAALPPCFCQQSWAWHEYTYENDGFSITFPYSPKPHPDQSNPNLTVYSIRLSQDSVLSVRTVKDNRPCSDTLPLLNDGANKEKANVQRLSIQGHPAIDTENETGSNRKFERYVCTGKRYYIFSMLWPKGNPKPLAGVRIIDSFKLRSGGEE